MFRLIRKNVERLVSTEAEKAKLEAQGFILVVEATEAKKEKSEMTVSELKKLAEEKGIEGFDKMKKEQLLKALEELEDNGEDN